LGSAEEKISPAVREIRLAEIHIDPEKGVNGERITAKHDRLRELLKGVDHPLMAAYRHRFDIELHPHGVVLRARMLEDIQGTLNGGVQVPLDVHLEGVTRMVESIAARHRERGRMARAARRHDIGKMEPRFQTMLHGDPFSAAAGPLLAKSGFNTHSQKRAAYFQSGLPSGFRHELASVHYSDEGDTLVRYLIASHHGFGRPWFPDCADRKAPGAHLLVLDSGLTASFSSLLKDHKIWGLAGMELLVRAADTRQSKAEQEAENDGVKGAGGIITHRFPGGVGNASRADPGSK
jgi:CRISPR-associated endonuclease/helicase Cas3